MTFSVFDINTILFKKLVEKYCVLLTEVFPQCCVLARDNSMWMILYVILDQENYLLGVFDLVEFVYEIEDCLPGRQFFLFFVFLSIAETGCSFLTSSSCVFFFLFEDYR